MIGGNELDIVEKTCAVGSGTLSTCAPLALAYVPKQQSSASAYEPDEALSRGTLFPELDLPFKNIVNATMSIDTPEKELMALDFVAHELELYLDTHRDDSEAFAAFQGVLRLSREGRERYTRLYGPISVSDQLDSADYAWLNEPWPWDYSGGER
jgi:spore coat protein JB